MSRNSKTWQQKESRHYCAVCNAWMGNDRQSILLHEQGKKHKENVEKSLAERRENKAAQSKQQQQLASSLKAMEQAALQQMATGDDSLYYDTHNYLMNRAATTTQVPPGYPMMAQPTAPPPPPTQQPAPSAKSKKKEQEEYRKLKKQRHDEKIKGKKDKDEEEEGMISQSKAKRRQIAPDEGHYTIDNKIYLEGTTFDQVLEEDMPIQIWIGSLLATQEERKLAHNASLWMNGLVVALRKRPDIMSVDVAYLKQPTDEEETLEKNVALDRIRIILGGDNSIPETLEEARVLAMGGEEIIVNDATATPAEIDEATGLTGWSTVSIQRTTKHQEEREERARQRLKEREARRKAEDAKRDAERRKLEESKVQNAEDSALGAFDVWSQTKKGGYKGVDIHAEAHVTVADTAKKLATEGAKVAFKKPSGSKFNKSKLAGKKRNRRTTSADDD